MALPEHTKYKDTIQISKGLKNIARAITNIPKKGIDVSKYSSIPTSVNASMPDFNRASQMDRQASMPKVSSTTKLGTVTTPYGGSTRYEKFHPAIDIANKIGTPVQSFVSGVVTEVARGYKQGQKGYGNYVIVTDAQGNQHRYSHLNNDYVKVGQKVGRGQVIGGIGNTGSTYSLSGGTGAHLDYRVKNMMGKYLNPSQFIYL